MRMPVHSDVKQDLEKPENIAQAFVVFLREMGVNVPISSSIVFYQALAHINVSKRNDVYWAGRSTLVTNLNDFPTYDEAFQAFWEDFITLNGIDLETATEIVTSFGEESDESGSLDEETEREIMNSVYLMKGKKTIFISSHKKNILDRCDTILKFEKGKITSTKNK